MPRVKRGIIHNKKRRNLLKRVKGFKWGRKSKIRLAKAAALKAGVHAFRDRRAKKRVFRRLWNVKINAGARANGTTYSRFIDGLKKHNINLDRKVLAEIAEKYPKVFAKIAEKIK